MWPCHPNPTFLKAPGFKCNKLSNCTENEAKMGGGGGEGGDESAVVFSGMNRALVTKILHMYLLLNIWSFYIHEI